VLPAFTVACAAGKYVLAAVDRLPELMVVVEEDGQVCACVFEQKMLNMIIANHLIVLWVFIIMSLRYTDCKQDILAAKVVAWFYSYNISLKCGCLFVLYNSMYKFE
jgi:hypothetical protein